MKKHECILSEKPDALNGALEWLQSEIKKMEAAENTKDPITKALEDDIRPLVLEAAKKRGLVPNR